jgi:hypothetical protein
MTTNMKTNTQTALPLRYAKAIDLMSRPQGATVAEIADANGWLPHTARALLSTARSGFGLDITKDKDERGTVYRLPAGFKPIFTKRAAEELNRGKPARAKGRAKSAARRAAPKVKASAKPRRAKSKAATVETVMA